MAGRSNKIVIPTGFESQQRAIERRRKIAEAMLAQGLGPSGPMQSWAQVLGKIAQTGVGTYLDKKVDKLADEYDEDVRGAYAERLGSFQEKANALDPASPTYDQDLKALAQEAQGDSMLEDAGKPYVDAMAARLKEQGETTNFGGQFRRKGNIKEGEFEPNDPNDMMLRSGPEGRDFVPNAARITAALASQPNVSISNAVTATRDPMAQPQGLPAQPVQGAEPVMPAGDEAGMVFQNMTPDEKQIINGILQKYAGKGAELSSVVPFGNPTDPNMGGRPPDGTTTDGRPYWMVNGVPYDNPEGR